MNFVEPIRNTTDIEAIKHYFTSKRQFRNLLLFVFGINTALRVSDLLSLRVGDIYNTQERVLLPRFVLIEKKRGKRYETRINESMQRAFALYAIAYPSVLTSSGHALFFSHKPVNYTKPLTRCHVWVMLQHAYRAIGLTGSFGTHTLRKTWGFHARKNHVDISLIMYRLNHANMQYTDRYLGITDEELGRVTEKINL